MVSHPKKILPMVLILKYKTLYKTQSQPIENPFKPAKTMLLRA